MTTLLLIRHAETLWNEEGRLQGHLDSPLTEKGRDESTRLGRRLAGQVARVISSDADRSRTTARRALGETIPIEIDAAWRERSLGAWEGQRWDDVKRADAVAADAYRHTAAFRPPRGESWHEVMERVRARLDALRAEAFEGAIAIFTSGGPVRAAAMSVLGAPPDRWRQWTVWNTGITRLDHGADGWRVSFFNDTGHLLAGNLSPAGPV